MRLPWNKKSDSIAPVPVDPVVEDSKKRLHVAGKSALRETDRLNRLFERNGVTLYIMKSAAGGGKHGH